MFAAGETYAIAVCPPVPFVALLIGYVYDGAPTHAELVTSYHCITIATLEDDHKAKTTPVSTADAPEEIMTPYPSREKSPEISSNLTGSFVAIPEV